MFLNYNNFHNICYINPEIRNHNMTGNLRRSRKQQLMRGNNAVAIEKE